MRGAITIPGLDSILAGGSRATKVVGLDDVPVDERPPANLVHLSFQAMVAIGFGLVGLAAWFGLAWWRRRTVPASAWFLRGAAVAGVASVAALEAGWVTTELGRQPWIAYKLMRTSEAVTHVGGVWVSLRDHRCPLRRSDHRRRRRLAPHGPPLAGRGTGRSRSALRPSSATMADAP